MKKLSFRVSFFCQYYFKKVLYIFKKRSPSLKRVHINAFPAVHLKHMDWWDFGVKFSSELLILTLAILAAFLNFYFFSFGGNHSYKDQSLAAAFLNLHPEFNRVLADKNSAIYTTVSDGGFIAKAQADDFSGFQPQENTQDSQTSDQTGMADDGLVKPNPDSVQGLIEKQIKVYQTQSKDTLKSIASQNGISPQTIIWANNLSSDQIKAGWYLLIPPVDGILIKADSNTTLPDLADKYNPERYNKDKKIAAASADALLEKIISYNGLANAEDIDNGQIVIIPGGKVVTPPAQPKPVLPKPVIPKSTIVNDNQDYDSDNSDYGGHIFPWGYCTWYVASRVHIPWGGNAKNWLANAKAYGAVVTKEPAVGAIVVTNESRRYGHVALVEEVTEDRILVSEMNYTKFGKVDQRWINKNSSVIKGYIYP